MSEPQGTPVVEPEKAAKPATEAPPVETPAEPETPPAPDIKAEALSAVVGRRDAKQLAAIVRQQKQIDTEKERIKAADAKLAAIARMEKAFDEDDDAAAVDALLEYKFGADAAQRKGQLYDRLTGQILRVESKAAPSAKYERRASALEQDFEAIKQELAQAKAEKAEAAARERELQEQNAASSISTWLSDPKVEAEYPCLAAEADDPGVAVYELLAEAKERGQELTVGEAAALLNEHFQPAFEKKKARYQNLLAPNKATDSTKPETRQSQSTPSRTSITNADASQAAATPPELPPPATEAERLERSWQVLRRGSGTKG